MQRVDQQLRRRRSTRCTTRTGVARPRRCRPARRTEPTASSATETGCASPSEGVREPPKPALIPPALPESLVVSRPHWFTAHAPDSGTHYRVLADAGTRRGLQRRAHRSSSRYRSRDVDQTLRHLFVVELLVAACVLGRARAARLVGRAPRPAAARADGRDRGRDRRAATCPAGSSPPTSTPRSDGSASHSTRCSARSSRRSRSELHRKRACGGSSPTRRTSCARRSRRSAATPSCSAAAPNARPDDLAKAMQRIEEAAARMGVLVEDLLLLARLDQGRPLEHAPRRPHAARRAPRSTTCASPRPIARSTSSRAARSIVNGDENRLRQVLANLLENARTHTPPTTPIEVWVGDRRRRRGDRGARPGPGHERRKTRHARSNASGAPTRHAPARAAAPGSASRSSPRSPKPTADGPRSRPRRARARRSASASRAARATRPPATEPERRVRRRVPEVSRST